MRQFLLDLNVLLDVFLNRPPWAADAAAIWDAHRNGQLRALVAAFSIPTLFYIARRQAGLAAAQTAVQHCLSTLDIVPIDQTTLLAAQALSGPDFEDNLQIACAVQMAADGIVTRDPGGFVGSPIPVLAPADLAASLRGPTTP